VDKAKIEGLQKWLKIAHTYASKAAREEAYRIVTSLVSDIIERLERSEADRDEARKENDFMRLRLAESDKACVYCSLPKAEMGACAHGFPGCARADDLFYCDELTRRDAQQRREGAAEWLEGYLDVVSVQDPEAKSVWIASLEQAAKRLREGK